MYEMIIQVQQKNGLHVRSAASLIAMLQNTVNDDLKLKNINIEYKGVCVGITNLLSLVSLKVKQGDYIKLIFEDIISPELKTKIRRFFTNNEQAGMQELETDRLLMENSVVMQEAVSNMPNGMIVVNSKNIITFVNDAAVRLLEVSANDLLNRRADKVIPHSRLRISYKLGRQDLPKNKC